MQVSTESLLDHARAHHVWQDRPVDDDILRRLFDLMKRGPTSANCYPARILFVKSAAAKAQQLSCLMEGNRAQTAAAPVTANIGMDMTF